MQTSENGIAAIKRREGFTSKPKDDNGHLMWGHGHDQRPGEPIPDLGVTEQDADLILRDDLADGLHIDSNVSKLAPWANQNQHDALASFAYNEGISALATMLHHGQDQVPVQILAWCYEHKMIDGIRTAVKNEGLLARRKDELEQYGS